MLQTEDKWKIMANRRSDRKSKKGIMVSSKSQAECKQGWTDYSLIIHCLQMQLSIESIT